MAGERTLDSLKKYRKRYGKAERAERSRLLDLVESFASFQEAPGELIKLTAKNLALRDQLRVFQRNAKRAKVRPADQFLWALLDGAVADGICLDDEGAIWVASPTSSEALRVREGGEVTERANVSAQASASLCIATLGTTLFLACGPSRPQRTGRPSWHLEPSQTGVMHRAQRC